MNWYDIPGFSKYRVNDLGEIWRCHKTGEPRRKLKPIPRPEDGRGRVTLCPDSGKYVKKYVSYFVLLATVGPKPDGMEACHNNGDCTDDRPINLRWDTSVANKADMRLHGTLLFGERNKMARLTDQKVREIRMRLATGERPKAIGQDFGVCEATIYAIQQRFTWRHVV